MQLLQKLYLRSQPQSSSPSVHEYLTTARDRSEILGTIKEWLCTGGGAQDALNDIHLYSAISSFLGSSTDHTVLESPNYHDSAAQQAWRALQTVKDAVISSFASQTRRPARIVYKHVSVPLKNEKVAHEPSDLD